MNQLVLQNGAKQSGAISPPPCAFMVQKRRLFLLILMYIQTAVINSQRGVSGDHLPGLSAQLPGRGFTELTVPC